MKGSILAEYIMNDYRKQKYYKDKKRTKCIIDKQKQCNKCKYAEICEDMEIKDEIQN